MPAVTPRADGRRERSRRTRARIVAASAALFVERGYVATTIEAIADAAGVATQTVYYVFGTKPAILRAVLEASVVGDLEPVPVAERPWVTALAEECDAQAALDLLVTASVSILERVAPIYGVLRSASAEPDVRALLDDTRRRRRADQRGLVDALVAAGHLRADVEPGTAADVMYALVNEDVFLLLVGDCRWELSRFRDWLSRLLCEQLLVDDSPEMKRPRASPRRER